MFSKVLLSSVKCVVIMLNCVFISFVFECEMCFEPLSNCVSSLQMCCEYLIVFLAIIEMCFQFRNLLWTLGCVFYHEMRCDTSGPP